LRGLILLYGGDERKGEKMKEKVNERKEMNGEGEY
jgi:hypothetical protein